MDKQQLQNIINKYKQSMMQEYKNYIPTIAQQSEQVDTVAESETYEQFLEENKNQGFLKIQASTAQRSLPITDAHVIVSKTFNGEEKVFLDSYTDENGIIDNIALPAKDRSLSEEKNYDGKTNTTYQIKATHPQYQPIVIKDVSIFEGVKSIQPLTFVPLR